MESNQLGSLYSLYFYTLICVFFMCPCRYDLMVACKEIGEGKREAPELLGGVEIKPISAADAYVKKLESKRVGNSQIISLLERYSERTKKIGGETKAVEYQI